MKLERKQDEYLEKLWYLKEDKKDDLAEYKGYIKEGFDMEIVKELVRNNHIVLEDGDKKIKFTEEGLIHTRQLIRAHRLAERMVHDVLGGDFEAGACEFEHIMHSELIDGICTLLGHPRECPHGMPIPEGECCKRSDITTKSSVMPATNLQIGESAKVAYVNCQDDQRLHKLDGLHIRPGMTIKMHQTYPSYVLECEGANIAMDKEIASNICVWKSKASMDGGEQNKSSNLPPKRFRLGWKK
ncbi:MAG: metal-dependent transcriptional regulator [Candidatus Omnitrophica bacterium]|nr:metal-dependent transcriptional regulator [Candidatus Omnitrophota bacterium]